jgi:tetratricopeptide (TPR) repeat protein
MRTKIWCTLALCAVFAGCASAPPTATDLPWHDQRFGHDPALVDTDLGTLFALDAPTLRELQSAVAGRPGGQGARTARLLELVFGPDLKTFAYAGGHSTPAAQTWHNRRGDCLSLSILTVALARALDVQAQLQEVRVPPLFDRRGTVDFLNQHVNVLVPNERDLRAGGRLLPAGAIVVDFEPQPGTRAKGRPLTDAEVLARFLNNRAAEQLAAGDERRAYAHFKAAILADPGFLPAQGNLAQLYLRAGLQADAEVLLRRALAHDDSSDFALVSLQQLMLVQGRADEARAFAAALAARRDRDPYYWFGLGLRRLQDGEPARAAAALERAQALTSGFAEIHQVLAIAYWRDGRLHEARDQLARLDALGGGEGKLALLQRKLAAETAATR